MSKPKKVNKLSDLTIDEVSLVDRGANQHASLLISKRDDGEEEEDEEPVDKADPDASGVTTGHEEEEEEDGKKKRKKGFFKNMVEKMFEESTTDPDDDGNIPDMDDVEKAGLAPGMQLPYGMQPQGQPAPGPQNVMPQQAQAFPGQPGQMQAGPPLPAEVIQYIQQLEQALAAAQGGQEQPSGDQEENVNPFGKSADFDDDDITFLQELSKNLEDEETSEAVNKALEMVTTANERAEQAENIAKAERDHRLLQEHIAKARSFTNLPIDAEEFGPVLKKLTDTLDEDELDTLTKALSAANETIADLGVFSEIGKRGIDGYESVSKAEAKAEEIVKNSGGEVSHEAALAQVFESSPEMYDEYIQERSGR